ncbi:MAG TPA: UV DNA damage repair endonuclease UvsE [Bacillota bacterium]|nr:UV DNA damage repair endonuclease UvsE [Bacillota bacterium]
MRWGYCCIALGLENSSTAHTVTVTNIKRIPERADRFSRLEQIARENLKNTIRLLRYNKAHDIMMYRFSSQLVPLATHEESDGWNYPLILADAFQEVGEVVHDTGMRVSTHPGQHTVINSPSASAWELAQKDLDYHDKVLTGMGLDNHAIMVVHVGGAYGDKKQSASRFVERFKMLPLTVQNRIVVENDDRSFTAEDVLDICRAIERPMVLDIHHQRCLVKDERWLTLVPEIFATWGGVTPKVHISSPRNDQDPRSHANDVDPDYFLSFVEKWENVDFDVMVEAKNKDLALFHLREAVEARQKTKMPLA